MGLNKTLRFGVRTAIASCVLLVISLPSSVTGFTSLLNSNTTAKLEARSGEGPALVPDAAGRNRFRDDDRQRNRENNDFREQDYIDRVTEDRNSDNRYNDDRRQDDRYSDDRHSDDRHQNDRYQDDRYSDDRYQDDRRQDDRYSDDDRYQDDDRRQDDRYSDDDRYYNNNNNRDRPSGDRNRDRDYNREKDQDRDRYQDQDQDRDRDTDRYADRDRYNENRPNNNYHDRDEDRTQFNSDKDDQFDDEPGPCRLLLTKFKSALLRDRSIFMVEQGTNIRNFGDQHGQKAEISGFNSFVVKDCSPLVTGVMTMIIQFNELHLVSPRGHNEEDRYNERRNTDRRRYGKGDRMDKVGDYYDDDEDQEQVWVRGVELVYRFVSGKVSDSREVSDVSFNIQDAKYRIPERFRVSSRSVEEVGRRLLTSVLPDLEAQFDIILQDILEDIRLMPSYRMQRAIESADGISSAPVSEEDPRNYFLSRKTREAPERSDFPTGLLSFMDERRRLENRFRFRFRKVLEDKSDGREGRRDRRSTRLPHLHLPRAPRRISAGSPRESFYPSSAPESRMFPAPESRSARGKTKNSGKPHSRSDMKDRMERRKEERQSKRVGGSVRRGGLPSRRKDGAGRKSSTRKCRCKRSARMGDTDIPESRMLRGRKVERKNPASEIKERMERRRDERQYKRKGGNHRPDRHGKGARYGKGDRHGKGSKGNKRKCSC